MNERDATTADATTARVRDRGAALNVLEACCFAGLRALQLLAGVQDRVLARKVQLVVRDAVAVVLGAVPVAEG